MAKADIQKTILKWIFQMTFNISYNFLILEETKKMY